MFVNSFLVTILFVFLQNCTGKLGPCSYRNSRKSLSYLAPYEQPQYQECMVQGDIVCKNNNVSKKSEEVDIEDGPFVEGDIIPSHSNLLHKNIDIIKWPNGTVPFVFNKNIASKGRRLIIKAMNEFHKTTCIQFIKHTNETDYLMIGSNFPHVCASHIGRQGGKQILHLGPGCYRRVGTTIHELMHALGFYHEHMRPDRDKFVYINYSNIDKNLWKNFNELNPGIIYVPNAGQYDFGSIMHYNLCAMSNNTWPTIIPKVTTAGSVIGQRNGFSLLDIMKINNFYTCGQKYNSHLLNIADFVNSSPPKHQCINFISSIIIYIIYN